MQHKFGAVEFTPTIQLLVNRLMNRALRRMRGNTKAPGWEK
jgi:hypothetical protein